MIKTPKLGPDFRGRAVTLARDLEYTPPEVRVARIELALRVEYARALSDGVLPQYDAEGNLLVTCTACGVRSIG